MSKKPVAGHNTNHGDLKHKVNHVGHGNRNSRPGSLLALIPGVVGAGGPATFNSANTIPAGSRITGVTVDVTQAFNGVPTLRLGTTGNLDFIFPVGTIDLTQVGPQALDLELTWPINSVARATLGGGPNTGAATIRVVYED